MIKRLCENTLIKLCKNKLISCVKMSLDHILKKRSY